MPETGAPGRRPGAPPNSAGVEGLDAVEASATAVNPAAKLSRSDRPPSTREGSMSWPATKAPRAMPCRVLVGGVAAQLDESGFDRGRCHAYVVLLLGCADPPAAPVDQGLRVLG